MYCRRNVLIKNEVVVLCLYVSLSSNIVQTATGRTTSDRLQSDGKAARQADREKQAGSRLSNRQKDR